MAADAASSSAVIAGRSHTSTRPVSSCRVSSANRLGHFGPVGAAEASAWEAGGDTGPAARRCSHARCRPRASCRANRNVPAGWGATAPCSTPRAMRYIRCTSTTSTAPCVRTGLCGGCCNCRNCWPRRRNRERYLRLPAKVEHLTKRRKWRSYANQLLLDPSSACKPRRRDHLGRPIVVISIHWKRLRIAAGRVAGSRIWSIYMDRSYSGSGTLQPSLTPRSGPVPLRWHRSHHRTEQVFSDSGARRRAGDTSETPWWGRAAAAGVDLWRALPHVRQSLAASRQSGGYRCGIGRVRRG